MLSHKLLCARGNIYLMKCLLFCMYYALNNMLHSSVLYLSVTNATFLILIFQPSAHVNCKLFLHCFILFGYPKQKSMTDPILFACNYYRIIRLNFNGCFRKQSSTQGFWSAGSVVYVPWAEHVLTKSKIFFPEIRMVICLKQCSQKTYTFFLF